MPYAYSLNNLSANFGAACHICNGWKSDHVFQSLDEARVYLSGKWAADEKPT